MSRRRAVLILSLSGPDPEGIVRGLARLGWAPAAPDLLEVNHEKRKPGAGWIDAWLPKAQHLTADSDEGATLTFDRKSGQGGIVTLRRPDTDLDAPATFQALGTVPYELAVIGPVYPEWWDEERPTYSFSDGHVAHGWACAFRGAGFDRLVSRRWLDFGPWWTRDVVDATWVAFHDLDADAKTALAQAIPGWQRMGISDTGGFIQSGFVYKDDVDGVYDPAERKLKVMVPSGEVSQRKMLEIAAARRDPRIQKEKRIERTAFVFLDEQNARRHLHELWLRDHECWAIVDGREVRLDLDYHPTPEPPDWVRDVAARAARGAGP
jgi:hypothetical protein